MKIILLLDPISIFLFLFEILCTCTIIWRHEKILDRWGILFITSLTVVCGFLINILRYFTKKKYQMSPLLPMRHPSKSSLIIFNVRCNIWKHCILLSVAFILYLSYIKTLNNKPDSTFQYTMEKYILYA